MGARLENKVALITGAGRGIGRAIAYKMAHEGAMVALAEIDFESAQSAAEELTKEGCQALAIQTDITRETEVQAAVAQALEHFGRVDILVNNAGKNFYHDATTMSEADWDNAMNVDVKGAWLCCKHVLPEDVIWEFVERHIQWIEEKKAELRVVVPIQVKKYQSGETFLYLGREYSLEVVGDQHKKLILEDRFKIAETALKKAELVFQNWYRQQAKQWIVERVKQLAENHQFHYEKIKITSARTRWGSCSSKNTLSFSWRLMLTSPDVIDYVIIHELAHTVHHNHSKRFWNLVGKLMPDYKKLRKRLKDYGKQML